MLEGTAKPIEPLRRFPALRSRDLDELRIRMSNLFSVNSMDLDRRAHESFEVCLNHRQLRHVGLTYARYGAAVEASLSHADFFLQGFPLQGGGSCLVDGSDGLISRNHGIVGGPNADVRVKYSSDFEHFILRVGPQELSKKLSSLIGHPVDPPLQLSAVGPSPEKAAAQMRLLEFVVQELDRDDQPLPQLVLEELEQALVVAYLCSNLHNYSAFLEGRPRAVAPWQVRRAEEYIEQNWDQPITVEALALVVNASARSLFYSFRENRGVTPMAFVRQVRLRHAREMLMTAAAETSVTAVAFSCGFSNLGHFAKNYLMAFGEHPSATLRASLAGLRRSYTSPR
jgi:AraC-like DNA-binding protein